MKMRFDPEHGGLVLREGLKIDGRFTRSQFISLRLAGAGQISSSIPPWSVFYFESEGLRVGFEFEAEQLRSCSVTMWEQGTVAYQQEREVLGSVLGLGRGEATQSHNWGTVSCFEDNKTSHWIGQITFQPRPKSVWERLLRGRK
jgi:hypothetical protein